MSFYVLIQEFNFSPYKSYVVKFEEKPQHRDDVIFAQIGKTYSNSYKCIIDKKTGDILEAWENGDFHYRDKKDKVNDLFNICGYTKDKLTYIADVIYNLGNFYPNC